MAYLTQRGMDLSEIFSSSERVTKKIQDNLAHDELLRFLSFANLDRFKSSGKIVGIKNEVLFDLIHQWIKTEFVDTSFDDLPVLNVDLSQFSVFSSMENPPQQPIEENTATATTNIPTNNTPSEVSVPATKPVTTNNNKNNSISTTTNNNNNSTNNRRVKNFDIILNGFKVLQLWKEDQNKANTKIRQIDIRIKQINDLLKKEPNNNQLEKELSSLLRDKAAYEKLYAETYEERLNRMRAYDYLDEVVNMFHTNNTTDELQAIKDKIVNSRIVVLQVDFLPELTPSSGSKTTIKRNYGGSKTTDLVETSSSSKERLVQSRTTTRQQQRTNGKKGSPITVYKQESIKIRPDSLYIPKLEYQEDLGGYVTTATKVPNLYHPTKEGVYSFELLKLTADGEVIISYHKEDRNKTKHQFAPIEVKPETSKHKRFTTFLRDGGSSEFFKAYILKDGRYTEIICQFYVKDTNRIWLYQKDPLTGYVQQLCCIGEYHVFEGSMTYEVVEYSPATHRVKANLIKYGKKLFKAIANSNDEDHIRKIIAKEHRQLGYLEGVFYNNDILYYQDKDGNIPLFRKVIKSTTLEFTVIPRPDVPIINQDKVLANAKRWLEKNGLIFSGYNPIKDQIDLDSSYNKKRTAKATLDSKANYIVKQTLRNYPVYFEDTQKQERATIDNLTPQAIVVLSGLSQPDLFVKWQRQIKLALAKLIIPNFEKKIGVEQDKIIANLPTIQDVGDIFNPRHLGLLDPITNKPLKKWYTLIKAFWSAFQIELRFDIDM